MPRYFFDIQDKRGGRDEIGREFRNHKALRNEAMKAIAGLTATEGETSDGWTIVLQVRDEEGAVALTIRAVCQVEDAVMPRRPPQCEPIDGIGSGTCENNGRKLRPSGGRPLASANARRRSCGGRL